MYGFEALWFNVKDGYLGKKDTSPPPPLGLGRQAHPSPGMRLIPENRRRLLGVSLAEGVPGRPMDGVCVRADAVVRGHRSGLLSASDYNNLCQCESLDDIKLNLVCASPSLHDWLTKAHMPSLV